MQYTCKYLSPLGEMLLASDGEALTGAWFEGQKYYAAALAVAHEEKSLPVFEETRTWLDGYFNGRKPGLMPLIHLQGSPFRLAVWDLALEIARKRGIRSMSAQAVGGAVAHNPVSVIIPCHRVVSSHGSLTGYAGGLERKVRLLNLEGADLKGFFVPGRGTAL